MASYQLGQAGDLPPGGCLDDRTSGLGFLPRASHARSSNPARLQSWRQGRMRFLGFFQGTRQGARCHLAITPQGALRIPAQLAAVGVVAEITASGASTFA